MAGSGSPLGINERREIKRLLGKMSMTKIAERLNRSKNCVITEVRINGGAAEYDPEKAHKRADDAQKEGRERANAVQDLKEYIENARMLLHTLREEKREVQNLKDDLKKHISICKGANHMLPLIQALDQRVVTLEEKVDHLLNVKPLYIGKIEKKSGSLEKRLADLEILLKAPKPDAPTKATQSPQRLIKASEWNSYHDWPGNSQLNKLIRERETNGLGAACFKVGKKWMIDEEKFVTWSIAYKESLIKQAKGE